MLRQKGVDLDTLDDRVDTDHLHHQGDNFMKRGDDSDEVHSSHLVHQCKTDPFMIIHSWRESRIVETQTSPAVSGWWCELEDGGDMCQWMVSYSRVSLTPAGAGIMSSGGGTQVSAPDTGDSSQCVSCCQTR